MSSKLYFAGKQRVANCAWFALRNLVQRNAVSAKSLRELADFLMEGFKKHALEPYFAPDSDGLYLLDGKDAVDYDIQVIKGQLAFLGYVLSDRTRTAVSPLRDYATVLGDGVPEAAGGSKFLLLVETKDDPPCFHYAVLLRGGVKNKNAKPYRWLDSLRAHPATYWTFEEFLAAEAPNYGTVRGVFEMVRYYFPLFVFTTCLGVFGGLPMRFPLLRLSFTQEAGEKYESMDSYLQAIQVAVHNS